MPREAEARESDGAEAPLVVEAIEGEAEAPRIPEAIEGEAEATEVGASRSTEAEAAKAGALGSIEIGVAETRAPGTTEAGVAEAGAPGTTKTGVAEASVSVVKLAAQEAEMKVAEASVPPLVQGPSPLWESVREVEVHSISSDDTSRGEGLEKEASWAAEASVAVQVVLEAEIEGHTALRSAARTACEALEVEGV
ncbi:uncharacterized protein [Miscanthus floridulus]|uniref:uncharacterized protein n=1 Tax=Miscanthus floridulus TaxID=154761 RepID=UPI0034599459